MESLTERQDEVLAVLEDAGINRERVMGVDRDKVDDALDVTELSESDVYDIEDLLTVAHVEETVNDPDPVELASVVTDCWRNVKTGATTLVTATDRVITADRSRPQQLLENLIRNAVDHGGTDVTLTVGDLEDGFYVKDDGPGIPEKDREKVFDLGYSTAQAGTGLGLSIIKQVVEAHDWTLRLTEGSGDGARFEIT